jgi:subtilisin family serine protease
MSTPIVAGLAAVIKSANKTTSPKKIRDIILKTGTKIPQLEGLLVSPSVINVQMALKELLL